MSPMDLHAYAGNEPIRLWWKFDKQGPITGVFVKAEEEMNKFTGEEDPVYYVEDAGIMFTFRSKAKALAKQLAGMEGKRVTITRSGRSMQTKYNVEEVKE